MNRDEAIYFLAGMAAGLTTASPEETIRLWLRIAKEFHIRLKELESTVEKDITAERWLANDV